MQRMPLLAFMLTAGKAQTLQKTVLPKNMDLETATKELAGHGVDVDALGVPRVPKSLQSEYSEHLHNLTLRQVSGGVKVTGYYASSVNAPCPVSTDLYGHQDSPAYRINVVVPKTE